MTHLKYLILFILLLNTNICSPQNCFEDYSPRKQTNNCFISSTLGIQISGIKSEDFVSNNISPSYSLTFGKWLNTGVGLQIGYKGPYFYSISDTEKHPYHFIYGEALFNLSELIQNKFAKNTKWGIIIHPGAGYFYNLFYGRPNICGTFGLSNTYKFKKRWDILLDISAIFGWDIYQGDKDILPACMFGLIYTFN